MGLGCQSGLEICQHCTIPCYSILSLLILLCSGSLMVGACGEALLEAGLAVTPLQPLIYTAVVWPPSCKAASSPHCS